MPFTTSQTNSAQFTRNTIGLQHTVYDVLLAMLLRFAVRKYQQGVLK